MCSVVIMIYPVNILEISNNLHLILTLTVSVIIIHKCNRSYLLTVVSVVPSVKLEDFKITYPLLNIKPVSGDEFELSGHDRRLQVIVSPHVGLLYKNLGKIRVS